ncbi:MAG: hypothetical protein FWH32_02870 [Clostridiales bacterium]|nr:hypothetical protein [Clostridiales bacterium]
MKQPLNYAILLYFTKHEEGDADSIMEELRPEYGGYRAFKRKGVVEALMTAKENGILDEVRAELAEGDVLRMWYKLSDYGTELIARFL